MNPGSRRFLLPLSPTTSGTSTGNRPTEHRETTDPSFTLGWNPISWIWYKKSRSKIQKDKNHERRVNTFIEGSQIMTSLHPVAGKTQQMEKRQEAVIQQTTENHFSELNKDLSLHTKIYLWVTRWDWRKQEKNLRSFQKEKTRYIYRKKNQTVRLLILMCVTRSLKMEDWLLLVTKRNRLQPKSLILS